MTNQPPTARRPTIMTVVPWIIAATCLSFALVTWSSTRQSSSPPALSPSAERERLLASPDHQRIAWKATEDPAARGVSGDVVWSPTQQRGFMRFVGGAPNDAAKYQYQLWIFDKTRDDRYPIDGGVFDVTNANDVIVPITAKLRVEQAAMFAVTVEVSGGVVVSDRKRVVVTAAPSI